MAKFIIQRIYSDNDEEKKGMSTAAKIGLGLGATALAFAGARRGMMGNTLTKATNNIYGKAGSIFKSNGMMQDAAKRIGNAEYGAAKAAGNFTRAEAVSYGRQAQADALKSFMK